MGSSAPSWCHKFTSAKNLWQADNVQVYLKKYGSTDSATNIMDEAFFLQISQEL